MQDQLLFEYAVIRVVPRVEREEFLNVGVVLFCKRPPFLQMRYSLDADRMQAFCATLDTDEVKAYLCAFEHICLGLPEGGPIARLDMPSRFRWLTATRSTIVQCSKVHPGFCTDPVATLEKLHERLVL